MSNRSKQLIQAKLFIKNNKVIDTIDKFIGIYESFNIYEIIQSILIFNMVQKIKLFNYIHMYIFISETICYFLIS